MSITSTVSFFFFFSSRRRHTRFDCDWSSDVCSSDLDLVLIPGLCEGDPAVIAETAGGGIAVEKGPKDLRQIPEYFGRAAAARTYGSYDIEIVAEVNNAPRLARDALRQIGRAHV